MPLTLTANGRREGGLSLAVVQSVTKGRAEATGDGPSPREGSTSSVSAEPEAATERCCSATEMSVRRGRQGGHPYLLFLTRCYHGPPQLPLKSLQNPGGSNGLSRHPPPAMKSGKLVQTSGPEESYRVLSQPCSKAKTSPPARTDTRTAYSPPNLHPAPLLHTTWFEGGETHQQSSQQGTPDRDRK